MEIQDVYSISTAKASSIGFATGVGAYGLNDYLNITIVGDFVIGISLATLAYFVNRSELPSDGHSLDENIAKDVWVGIATTASCVAGSLGYLTLKQLYF